MEKVLSCGKFIPGEVHTAVEPTCSLQTVELCSKLHASVLNMCVSVPVWQPPPSLPVSTMLLCMIWNNWVRSLYHTLSVLHLSVQTEVCVFHNSTQSWKPCASPVLTGMDKISVSKPALSHSNCLLYFANSSDSQQTN